MSVRSINKLGDLAPERTLISPVADSSAMFGVARRYLGLVSDYVILVDKGLSDQELMKVLAPLSSGGYVEDIYGTKADLGMPKLAVTHPVNSDGRETQNARLKRIHETDPQIRHAFNEFRADSLDRWDQALGEYSFSSKEKQQPVPPVPMKGVIGWRANHIFDTRRFLTRVETFEAAADMRLGLLGDSDLFLGRAFCGLWSERMVNRWPYTLYLRGSDDDQDRLSLQGSFMPSVGKYARQLFSKRNGLFQSLESEIGKRMKLAA